MFDIGDEVLFYFPADKMVGTFSYEEIPDVTLFRKKGHFGTVKKLDHHLGKGPDMYEISYSWFGVMRWAHIEEKYMRLIRKASWIGWFASGANPLGYNPGYVVIGGLSLALLLKYYRILKK